jgi:hypothetical protein
LHGRFFLSFKGGISLEQTGRLEHLESDRRFPGSCYCHPYPALIFNVGISLGQWTSRLPCHRWPLHSHFPISTQTILLIQIEHFPNLRRSFRLSLLKSTPSMLRQPVSPSNQAQPSKPAPTHAPNAIAVAEDWLRPLKTTSPDYRSTGQHLNVQIRVRH